jgi:Protein of unknown function (DUF3306)
MSEPENFITRWSRRKREAAGEAEAALPASAAPDASAESARAREHQRKESDAPAARAGEPPALPFDPASLPPLESITAASDIRAFLAPGVPAELTRAALRRAWAADPKIRDFVGLADYDWDFNTPGAMTGFGSLEMTDELRRHAARIVGGSEAGDEADRHAPTPAGPGRPASIETPIESAATTAAAPTPGTQSNVGTSQDQRAQRDNELHNSDGVSRGDKEVIASQYDPEKPDNGQSTAKRPHGRALPKL